MAFRSPILQGSSRLDAAAAGPPSIKRTPPADDPDAIRKIQKALSMLGFSMPISFPNGPSSEPDGVFGTETFNTVVAFQKSAFPTSPGEWDGRVGPKTLQALDDRLSGDNRFIGFTDDQVNILKADLARAQKFVDVVLLKLGTAIRPGSVDADTKRKVDNDFHVIVDNPDPITEAFRRTDILTNFAIVKRGLQTIFPFQSEPLSTLGRAAFVSNDFTDATVHIQANYFGLHPDDRAVTLIHERAHTVLKISGHPGSGDVLFCVVPDEGITAPMISYDEAIKNAYCYELLSLSLQPDYSPDRFRNQSMCTQSNP